MTRKRGADMLTIGCHLSSSKGYAQMARDTETVGGTTFQFFTRNPRGCKAKDIDLADVATFQKMCDNQGIGIILAHAPYTLNPASAKPDVREFARMVLADDLVRMESTPGMLYNMHPGSHVGQGAEEGIELIAAALNETLKPDQTTTLLLETMAGKGSEIGRTFEELRAIIDRVELADDEVTDATGARHARVGICLDTCHVWDGGYDVREHLDDVLEEFDRVIGLDRLRAVHLNDSKNPLAAHKDRHERIGEGHIGFEALSNVTRHPALRGLPFYLETPNEKLAGWAEEIAALKDAWI